MDGRLVNDVPCGERNVSMVFQNYALFPHMTVQSNIVYGLKAHKMDPAEIKTRLSEVLDMLDLERAGGAQAKRIFPAASARGWRWPGQW